MSFVAVAIGGSAVIGAGVGIAGGMMGANSAKEAAAQQESFGIASLQNQQNLLRSASSLFNPYNMAGIGAGNTLSSLFVDPTTKYNQLNAQRAELQAGVDQYSHKVDFASTPLLTGKNASERRQQVYDQNEMQRVQSLQQAQDKLKQFDTQYGQDYLSQLKGGTDPLAPKLQNSPFLQGVTDLTTRNVNRALAARGGYNSGAAYEAIGNALAPINYQASQFATQGLQSLYNTGANAAGNQASVTAGFAPTIGSIYNNMGNNAAAGTIGATQAQVNGMTGATNALTGAAGAGMQYSMYNSLLAKLGNQNAAGNVTDLGNGVGQNRSGGLVNLPGQSQERPLQASDVPQPEQYGYPASFTTYWD